MIFNKLINDSFTNIKNFKLKNVNIPIFNGLTFLAHPELLLDIFFQLIN